MLDIKFVRDNPDAVKENIKKKFQDAKLPLVDEVIEKVCSPLWCGTDRRIRTPTSPRSASILTQNRASGNLDPIYSLLPFGLMCSNSVDFTMR